MSAATAHRPDRSRLLLWVAIAVVLLFIAAMVTQYVRTRQVRAELTAVRTQLALARTEATIGAAAAEAQQGRYEPARQLASRFFTGLQRKIAAAPTAERAALQAILDQRDATITLLSRGDPAATARLVRLVTQYRETLHAEQRE